MTDSKVWSWFKRLGHWIAVGAQDADKFLLALQQSGLLAFLGPVAPGITNVLTTGIGVFEKILAGNLSVEKVSATLAQSGTTLTSAQKLTLATPDALAAFVSYANAAGLKITDMSKAAQIAQGVASRGADFLNIVEPLNGPKLAQPATPAADATASAPVPET